VTRAADATGAASATNPAAATTGKISFLRKSPPNPKRAAISAQIPANCNPAWLALYRP
jgi:hypothetical protein